MAKSFDELLAKVASIPMKKAAVCVSQDSAVIEAVRAAKDRKIADAILVGDAEKTKQIAAELNIDISDFEMIDVKDVTEASLTAVKLVHDGVADLYMKGLIDTKGFLKSVLDKEVGLRTGKTLSHVCVFDVKGYDRLMFLTDVAFLPYPTLEDKVNIIKNTVEICEAMGVENPKVAPLAAVEVVNPKMPVTVEAAELTRLNEEGEIKNCIVDGPLSMDLAIDPEAAKHKAGALDRKIVGDADILLFPDIHAGNLTYKTIVRLATVKNGNILTGTKAPVILTSRSDSVEVKVNSIALAAVVAEDKKKGIL
jgi:phosphate butyryltransferase